MEVGTLIRGELNELLGIVLDFKRSSSGHGMVRVYWFDIDEASVNWLSTAQLEVICK